jgi:hypothetical protein
MPIKQLKASHGGPLEIHIIDTYLSLADLPGREDSTKYGNRHSCGLRAVTTPSQHSDHLRDVKGAGRFDIDLMAQLPLTKQRCTRLPDQHLEVLSQ